MTTDTIHLTPCPADLGPRSGNSSGEVLLPLGAAMIGPVQPDTRERSDTYAGEVLRLGEYRVALCRDRVQFLLQRRRTPANEGATAAWDSVGFCTTRAALLRLWRAHTGQDGVDLLVLLPERIRREVTRGSQA